MFKLPDTPMPPATINAPVTVDVLAVVAVTLTTPLLVRPARVPTAVICGCKGFTLTIPLLFVSPVPAVRYSSPSTYALLAASVADDGEGTVTAPAAVNAPPMFTLLPTPIPPFTT